MASYKFMSFRGALNIILNSLIILLGIRFLMRIGVIPTPAGLGWTASWSGSGWMANPILSQQANTSANLPKYTAIQNVTPAITRKSIGLFTTR